MPLATADSDSGKVQLQIEGDTEVTTPFKLLCQPRCLTAGLYQGQLVVDTTFQEQEIMAATMSVVVQDAQTLLGARSLRICHLHRSECWCMRIVFDVECCCTL